jgi:integrase
METITTLMNRNQVGELPKVKRFLESIGRNSKHSMQTYHTALLHFQNFLTGKYNSDYTIESILQPIITDQINLYEMLEDLVAYEISLKLSVRSIRLHMMAVKSFFGYYDVEIVPSKFKKKVKLPKVYREDEEALDINDIRTLLFACNNRRLKAYLLTLACGGTRATEGLAIRLCDLDFDVNPTKVHIRKEFTKTRVARDIYISDEATDHLKTWIDWKYRPDRRVPKKPNDNDLVFAVYQTNGQPHALYTEIRMEFAKLLEVTGFDARKDGMKRRKITLHSFRRFVKTVMSNQVSQDYSEWALGHAKSPYYAQKEPQRREIYKNKCMPYLTFLNYSAIEATGKNVELKLSLTERMLGDMRLKESQKDQEIAQLKGELEKLKQGKEIDIEKQMELKKAQEKDLEQIRQEIRKIKRMFNSNDEQECQECSSKHKS